MEKNRSMKKKWNLKKKILLRTRLYLTGSGIKRANILKKSNAFHEFGENVYWHSLKIPNEPYLVAIHNNVQIATNVTMLTHDIISRMLNNSDSYNPEKKKFLYGGFYMNTIEIFDNVFIGANSTILYNTKIGPNAIVAAGSVVTKDVKPGTIVGGNPAKVIGYVDELAQKRAEENADMLRPTNYSTIEKINEFYWGEK